MMEKKQIEIGDTVTLGGHDENGKHIDVRYKVVAIEPIKQDPWDIMFHGKKEMDTLIGCQTEGVWGTVFVTEVSLDWDDEKKEYYPITEEEARKRGRIVITSR